MFTQHGKDYFEDNTNAKELVVPFSDQTVAQFEKCFHLQGLSELSITLHKDDWKCIASLSQYLMCDEIMSIVDDKLCHYMYTIDIEDDIEFVLAVQMRQFKKRVFQFFLKSNWYFVDWDVLQQILRHKNGMISFPEKCQVLARLTTIFHILPVHIPEHEDDIDLILPYLECLFENWKQRELDKSIKADMVGYLHTMQINSNEREHGLFLLSQCKYITPLRKKKTRKDWRVVSSNMVELSSDEECSNVFL